MTPEYTAYPDSESWLADRDNYIGASEVGSILGINPYRSAYTLWHEKKGLVPKSESGIAARMGIALEPLITDLYQEAEDVVCVDPGAHTVYTHPRYPWLRCTPDRLVMDGDRIARVVELKTIGERVAQQMRDGEPPIGYQVQLQTQLAVMGADHGDLACLIGNRDFQVFRYERHDRLIAQIVGACLAFWTSLSGDVPPPPDGHDNTARTIRSLHPDDNGETVDASIEIMAMWHDRALMMQEIKDLTERADELKNCVAAAMGGNTFATGDRFSLSYKTQSRQGYLKVATDHADALTRAGVKFSEVEGSKYRVLREHKKGNA